MISRRRTRAGHRVRGLVALALAVLVCGSAAACGIPVNSAPQAIPKNDVPFHLLTPSSPPTTSTNNPPVGVTEIIFLVDSTLHLIPARRNIAPPANLTQIVNALLLGPTDQESSEGIQSFVTGTTSLPSTSNRAVVTVANGIATVDFDSSPVQVVGGTQNLLAISQVVFTVTQQPNVTGVLFEIAGQPIEVPIAPNGALVAVPVDRLDYAPQAPITASVAP